MELFKWLIDIEEKYDSLINQAKSEGEEQVEDLKSQKDSEMESIIKKKKDFVDSVLNNLMNEVKEQITSYKEIKLINENYINNRDKLVQIILKKLGYDF
jgi:F0F1-type ATP synthase membrane subunit b/b'